MQYVNQNDLLMKNLKDYYKNNENIEEMVSIINGQSSISLRIVDWFTTNYSKKNWTVYNLEKNGETRRFKVFEDYKLKLKAYSKKRFDPFCRWDRVSFPYGENTYIQTTIGQLNFFKWAIENKVIDYIKEHYLEIDKDMNERNSIGSKKRTLTTSGNGTSANISKQTRKKRTELSLSAVKTIKKEDIEIQVVFH
tara:strand:- start:4285 stop:4866 length:582 start_codon:yes stop_codon:yes gene_type:complete